MIKKLDHCATMKIRRNLNLLFTLNMKKKYKMLETNKGFHKEEGKKQDIIQVLRTLDCLFVELEVEVFTNNAT